MPQSEIGDVCLLLVEIQGLKDVGLFAHAIAID